MRLKLVVKGLKECDLRFIVGPKRNRYSEIELDEAVLTVGFAFGEDVWL